MNIVSKTKLAFRNTILTSFNDSIKLWQTNIYNPRNIPSEFEEKTDSIVCINKFNDKLLIVRLSRALRSDNKLDALYKYYGIKINKKWYFIYAGTIQLFRNENELDRPTSFEKLHEIAMEEVFSGYLIENKKTGEWEINDAFFADFTSNAWYDKNRFVPKTQEDWDKIYLQIVADNWKHKDTTNYEQLREEKMKKKK